MFKTIFKKLMDLLFIVVVVLIVFYLLINIRGMGQKDYIPGLGPYKIMSVLSGSMSPTFNAGDVIVGKTINPYDLKQGDIITFRFGNSLTTHRVINVINKDGKLLFNTKGDNNNVEDLESVGDENIISKYLFRVPLLGFVIMFMKGTAGVTTICFLIILSIFINVYKGRNKKGKKYRF
ncbi:signal peptidase I [Clostridium sp. YIM B02515]|uniref:Signal peptidase I n=1 Tax=Clostridium rhizosphaerae TaxID=2803861 RepID=A0ABS1TDQ1_9CLOT|nr:signal peptidase I [Clostridium rhizosphaerae]MBL4937503.1 signal peptidase I [Clostridium rhizosphaerae]